MLMPKPTPIPVRRGVYDLWKLGWTAAQIAEHHRLPLRTVRNLIQRFQKLGEAGIETSYVKGTPPPSPEREEARQAAEQLRREHPAWGSGLICVYLRHRSELPVRSPR